MSERYFVAILVGALWGVINRSLLLRVDYRAYPSYPHAYASHLAFGCLAGLVGAVAPVALAARQFDAVTFLLLVATQFREIRKMERDKLQQLESIELVPRGANYIEGIAEVFEVRNYLVMFAAGITSGAVLLWGWELGALAGLILVVLTQLVRSDLSLQDVAQIDIAPVRFEGSFLFVEEVDFMNVALPELRRRIEEWG
ncbi:MAG: YIEGIA domain-containing protein, partial [Bacillota bacterium]